MEGLLKGAKIGDGEFVEGKFPFKSYEVEFKFYKGRLPSKGRPARWSLDDLEHILAVTKEYMSLDPVKSHSVVKYSDYKSRNVSIRKVKTRRDDGKTRVTYEYKESVHTENSIPELACKFTVNKESTIDPRGINFLPDKRVRDRYSFIDNDSRFDITVINQEFVEVELEILSSEFTLDDVKEYLTDLYGGYLPGDIPYSALDSALTFNGHPFTTTDARELSRNDLSYSSLFYEHGIKYYVSVKADGIRGYLILSEGKIWVITNLYFKLLPHTINDVFVKFSKKGLTIIEVEVMEGGFMFFYDCITIFGHDVKALNYVYRFGKMKNFTKFFNDVGVPCSLKEIFPLKDADSFFDTIETVNSTRDAFDTDGLVFTPDCPYYITDDKGNLVQRLSMETRTSGTYPDIIKWKDIITIDFMVKKGRLYYSDRGEDGKDELVSFEGDDFNPYDNTKKYALKQGIYEFMWSGDDFVMRNPRPDKDKPNNKNAVINNWRNIMNPITIDTLTGKDMLLIRNHHNNIKKKIFGMIPPESKILDIGSGRGGDLYKYPFGSTIIAVEPNNDNLDEFRRRYFAMEKDRKLTVSIINDDILNSVSKITNMGYEEVDAITMMLSASFFWKSPETVQKLAEVINKFLKPEGTLAIFTINGDVLRESLHLNPEYQELGLKIRLKPWEQGKGQVVKIDFPGTITERQTEYCVFMDYLESKLPDFDEKRFSYTGPMFMSKEQKKFNEFYTVHIYKRKKSTKVISVVPAWKLPREIRSLPSKYSSSSSSSNYASTLSKKIVATLDKDFRILGPDAVIKSIDNRSYYKSGIDDLFYLHSIPDDTNGLLHAILRAGHSQYLIREKTLITIDRRKSFAVGYRNAIPSSFLAKVPCKKLGEPYSSNVPYWCVCRNSKLSIGSLSNTQYLFTNIQTELMSNSKLNENNLWFIAKDIEHNIYLLKQENKSLSFISVTERIHKTNVIIIEFGGGYVVACHGKGETIFDNDHSFIEKLNTINPVTEDEVKKLKTGECVTAFIDAVIHKFIKGGYFSILEDDIMDSYLSDYIKSCLPTIIDYCDGKDIGYDRITIESVLASK